MRRRVPGLRPAVLLGLAAIVARTAHDWRRLSAAAPPPATPPLPVVAGWPEQPTVSVLVAAWNEAATIDDHVRGFLALTYPNRELLLAAGGADTTYDLARRWAGPLVTVEEQRPGEGKQRSLARLLARAQGSIVFLTDADCVLTDDAFLRTVAPVARGDAPVATGAAEPKPGQRGTPLVQYQWFTDLAWYSRQPDTVDGVLGRNCALRRDVLEAVGGFAAPARTGTDYVLSRLLSTARVEIRAVPASRVPTDYPATAAAYLRMWRRWNKNLLIHGPRYAAWNDVEGVFLGGGLAAVLLGLVLLAPLLWPLPLFAVPLLLAAVAGRLPRLADGARRAGLPLSWRLLLAVPFYTLLDMLGVLLAGLDAARPSTRDRW